MLLGAKTSKEIIRHGEDRAVVSASFSNVNNDVYQLCDELGLTYDRDDSFIIFRSLTSDGRNTVKINSCPATLAQLKAISSKLINIHGQNENHSFMNKANHILLLDEFAGVDEDLLRYSQLYSRLNVIKNEIAKLIESNKQKDTMVDILQYQIKEIASAKLKDAGEEEKLNSLRIKLKGAEKLIKSSSTAYKSLLQNDSGISACVLIGKAIDALEKIADVEQGASELIDRLTNYKYEIEDIAERAKDFASFDGIDDPQHQLEEVEDRLGLIQRLERKYGSTIEDVIKFKSDAEEKLKAFESAEDKIEDLKVEYKSLYSSALELAKEIHSKRVEAAKKLSKQVLDALVFLDMPKVRFQIDVNLHEKGDKPVLNSLGYDDVEFMIATNAGEELSAMSKIASGGELARIMLALKSALSDKNGADTIIFDEIDTGVSGSTSQKIGIKLAEISRTTQTFCVTHSAQIASLAQSHYLIKKKELDGRAETSIVLLEDEERVEEIARIIGGIDLTNKQYDAARELIAQSKAMLTDLN